MLALCEISRDNFRGIHRHEFQLVYGDDPRKIDLSTLRACLYIMLHSNGFLYILFYKCLVNEPIFLSLIFPFSCFIHYYETKSVSSPSLSRGKRLVS